MRKTKFPVLLAIVVVFLMVGSAAAKEKVILDSDMVELFDDGVAMLMLASHPDVDLLGVTVVAGNGWLQGGLARGVRQLELINRSDIPIVAGARQPMRTGRFEAVKTPNQSEPSWWGYERALFGIGVSSYTGAFGRAELDPSNFGGSVPPNANQTYYGPIELWKDYYQNRYKEAPKFDIAEDPRPAFKYKFGPDFIVEQVNKYPGEVTIIAIGPCTNLMMAVLKDPTIVPLVKRVIYMGGAVNVAGNTSPAAEFNWWFDPEAARFAVRTPWGKSVASEDKITQYVVPLDVCEKMYFTHEQYNTIVNLKGINPGIKALFESNYGSTYASPSDAKSFVWDCITVAILLGELNGDNIVLPQKLLHNGLPAYDGGYIDWWIDVNCDYNIDYGRSPGYANKGPVGTQKVRIINAVDENKFWNVLYSTLDPTYVPPPEPKPKPEPPDDGGCSSSLFGLTGLFALIPVLCKKR
ncbi:MAG: nucleoside hydrolase [Synergistaceae bacterium]|nr:nucleoside hydrolase [Synergistaceae bacterium]